MLDLVPFVQFKTFEKHPWRNVNFTKVARWHYSWKYNIRSSVNSYLSTVTIFWLSVESTGQKKRWYSYVIIIPCITKGNNLRWVFFTFLKLFKWHQITQRITKNQPQVVKLFWVKGSNKRIYCVSNNAKVVNSFLTIQTKNEYVSVFCRLSQNTILEGAVLNFLWFIQNTHKLHHVKM